MNDDDQDHRRDSVDMAYGGMSVTAKGSIVVIVVLLVAMTAANFWLAHMIERHMDEQDVLIQRLHDEFLRAEGIFAAKHDGTVQQIVSNRMYLREIERICILTNEQRKTLQDKLSPSMKELLELQLSEKSR